ncbi:type II toxin-antitoxin system CcdA family antitoxin [Sphingomonas sp. S1-29]|uniref:type II toxin-antitoxin system CcdA family antitoxin n=1 Tax=Sphingomonas sp. S1-29 TaxID=2991074 RepID=UPI002240525E|nr:type II toxin-antitoxin system CcdA family antitoxin [Sphingomonas sp. S1-29]UZK68561.1 type II toxin-antitoxin system CcdA family antitoxin [Sphingomonas sp. S1-29]
MKHERIATGKRKPVNLSIDELVLADARALGINLSQACETALKQSVASERKRRWVEENFEALQSSNEWVEKHGLPLAKYRMF